MPAGYVFEPGLIHVAELLSAHGVSVYRTTAAGEVEVDAAQLKSLERSKRVFQGVYMQHAIVEVKRFSPCTSEVQTRKKGALTCAERCVRPSPWMAASARQPGSSR